MISIKITILLVSILHLTHGQSTTFKLFTRANPTNAQILVAGNVTTLQQSNFNSNLQTWFHIHGWMGQTDEGIRDAILASRDVNVVMVDWIAVSNKDYITARYASPAIAGELQLLLGFLRDNGYALNKCHLIGFSLGAHVAGLAAKTLANGFPGSITGLDPASILYDINDPTTRLAPTDAAYVEVIHGSLIAFHDPLGDFDLYLNGGFFQPGRPIDPFSNCSHLKTLEAWVRSLNSTITGWKCSSVFFCENALFLSKSKNTTLGGSVPKSGFGLFNVKYNFP